VVRAAPSRRDLGLVLAIPAVVATVVLLLARQVDLQEESPGSVAQQLIAAARESCNAGGDSEVPVPIVKVSLRCRDGRLSGPAPFGKGTFAANELTPSADLSQFELDGFELSLAPGKSVPGLRIQAGEARIRGLRPWGRARSQPVLRFWSSWLAVICSSSAVVLLVRGQRTARAALVGLAAGLSAATASLLLDRRPGEWGLFLLPLSGVAAAVLAQLGWGLALALLAHFRSRKLRRERAIARAAGRW